MKQCRIQKTFKMQESEYVGDRNRFVGGLYPDTPKDDMWYQMVGHSGDVPELKGLKPEGFTDGDDFEIQDFDLQKLAEIRETALRYFVKIDGFDCEADIESVLSLVRELHACPESYTKGKLQAGELILALWLSGIPFKKFKFQDLPETIIFGMDWDSMSDPAAYIDNDHGFENLLRPSASWMKHEHVSGYGSDTDFICPYPKVQEVSLSGPHPVSVTP